jgi:MoxR-like ATPase
MPLVDFFHGDGRVADEISDFPRSVFSEHDDPAGYFAPDAVRAAVNVALNVGMPLLITGEPGTGKSVLAKAIARELKFQLIEFVAKSTTTATDLLYRFDAVRQFRDAQISALSSPADRLRRDEGERKEGADTRAPRLGSYIRFEALGRAIALTYPPEDLVIDSVWDDEANRIPGKDLPIRQTRSIVLIDEIDKAPRDVPNDLLSEIDRCTFRVAETGTELSVQNDLRPVVILTSNSEKSLPDAFLRRCVFHHIEFPAGMELARIIARRVPEFLTQDGQGSLQTARPTNLRDLAPLARDGIALLGWLRPTDESPYDPLRKPPSIAEFLAWLRLLLRSGFDPNKSLGTMLDDEKLRPQLESSLGILLKDRADFSRVIDGDISLGKLRPSLS